MMDDSVRTGGPAFPDPSWMVEALRVCSRALLVAGVVSAGSARAQANVPDSQVEANVLKALAGAQDLADQAISTNTVYGVVTLSGSVQNDALRVKAENLAATAYGVKKVVDELQVGPPAAVQSGSAPSPGGGAGMVLQSDGTYAPAAQANASSDQGSSGAPAPGTAPADQAQRNDPENDQALDQRAEQQQGMAPGAQTANGQTQGTPYPAPNSNGTTQSYPAPGTSQNDYPAYPQNGYPQNGSPQNGYPPFVPPNQNGYPQSNSQNGYPQGSYPQNGYPRQGYGQNGRAPWGGQIAGQPVQVPAGTMIRVRVNRLLASDKAKPGDHFDGVIANDVVAGGLVAFPRGAAVQGTVVDAKSSGALTGRGELAIQLNSVSMGGKLYPIVSDVWAHNGADKTIQTVNSAAGFGVVGALIGAVAGRGEGAAIGAGVGAAAGIGASAASPRGQVIIPPEGMVSFNLAQPVNVETVSEQEMQRLAYGVPPGQAPQPRIYPRPYGYPPPYPPPYGYPRY